MYKTNGKLLALQPATAVPRPAFSWATCRRPVGHGARMRPERLRSSKLAVLAVAAVATTCVWAAAQRTFLARAKPQSSDAPVTGIPDLDDALRKSWMFSGGRGAFPYGVKGGKGGNGKAGEPKVRDMNPEEPRKAMARVERAPSGGASVAPTAAEAALAGHCYSLHKPKLCPRKAKDNSRTAPDGSACTNAAEDHVDQHVEKRRLDGATAHCPGLLGLTLWASCCAARRGRATARPLRAQWEAAVRP